MTVWKFKAWCLDTEGCGTKGGGIGTDYIELGPEFKCLQRNDIVT